MGLKNIQRQVLSQPSNFRKLAMGNWGGIGDPQVYGLLELDCENVVKYIMEIREQHQVKVTVNHLIGRLLALVLHKYPQLNGFIANGKIYLRENIDIFFQVGLEDAETELVGICIKNADQKGIVEFASQVITKSEKVKASKDHPMRKTQQPFHYIPWRLVPWVVKFLNWLQFDWNLNLSWLGIPKDPLGSIMVTSVGSLGIDLVFVPLTHLGRTPAQFAVGKIYQKAVVVDDRVEVRSRLNLCCTFDHRFMEGVLASKMAHYLRELFENIYEYRDLIEGNTSTTDSQPTGN